MKQSIVRHNTRKWKNAISESLTQKAYVINRFSILQIITH